MARKPSFGERASGLRRRDPDFEEDERVIDPYDYQYRVYLFGEDRMDYDSDETEYREP